MTTDEDIIGDENVMMGTGKIRGNRNVMIGGMNSVVGAGNTAIGHGNSVNGIGNAVIGTGNTVGTGGNLPHDQLVLHLLKQLETIARINQLKTTDITELVTEIKQPKKDPKKIALLWSAIKGYVTVANAIQLTARIGELITKFQSS